MTHALQLPEGARAKIRTMLEAMGCWYAREVIEDADASSPYRVSYHVMGGDLNGWWFANTSSPDPDEDVFERMVAALDEAWQRHLRSYARVAKALRAVGR